MQSHGTRSPTAKRATQPSVKNSSNLALRMEILISVLERTLGSSMMFARFVGWRGGSWEIWAWI
jgi:hypothetical protein